MYFLKLLYRKEENTCILLSFLYLMNDQYHIIKKILSTTWFKEHHLCNLNYYHHHYYNFLMILHISKFLLR